jgi:hypothetical protein
MTEEEKKAFEEAKAARASAEAAAAKASKERQAAEAQIAQERAGRESLEAKLAQLEKDRRDAEMRALEPTQRVEREIQDLNARFQQREQHYASETAALRQQMRATELVAYRERVLRAVGEDVIHELIGGANEQEIDQSVEVARAEYARVSASIRAKVEADVASRYATTQGQPTQQYVPVYQQPPANPHFVQQGTQAPNAGLPTPTNPLQPTEAAPEQNMKELTSEEAVRSGQYGGEVRARMLAQLKRGGGQAVQMGSLPRHFVQPGAQPNHVQMPMGVQQPQGLPTAPQGHPQHQMQQPQQGQPANPQ